MERIPSRLLRVRDELKRLALEIAPRLFSAHLNGVDGLSAAVHIDEATL
jgi:hypothetical protein